MASRDSVTKKDFENNDDSTKRKNYERYHRGYNRRNNNYGRHETGERNLAFRNSYKSNGVSPHFNRNYNANKECNDKNCKDDFLSWRKTKNMESLINQRELLVTQITQRQYECMICCSNIELEVAIWSCENCYHIFHIDCIRQWSKTCGDENDNTSWRCPACQKEYSTFAQDLFYQCYCGKMKNPVNNCNTIPHSCGDVCGKSSKTSVRCPHLCTLLCHPGPCPMCEASVKSNCHCSKVEFIVKCSATESHLSCGNKCEKLLNCSVHICHEICHVNSCSPCQEIVKQKCCCNQTEREMFCGSSESFEAFFTCNNICSRKKDCGLHQCEKQCHPGPCQSCIRLPNNTIVCPCGKTNLSELSDSNAIDGDRKSCIDAIPTCDKICEKQYPFCEHTCSNKCHEGDCSPCSQTSNVKCRCNKTSQNIKCAEIARIFETGDSIKCTTRCKTKKQCGIHRCQDTCCDIQVHTCSQICGKSLSCKKHNCERPCHKGNCLKCDNVSFDELYCYCGKTNILPPIQCGQEPPYCQYPCSREHSCDHEVTHTCHSEPQCPVCTILTSKECPGRHKILYNIPCFRPVVTCGLVCNKPLPNCDHMCNKVCHDDDCTDESFVCTQLCTKLRTDCGHLCNRQCHSDECELDAKPCQSIIELRCHCNLKTMSVTCEKFEKLNNLLKSDVTSNKREMSEFSISENTIRLSCDNDCKKAARTKHLSEAFEIDSFNFDRTVYSSFLREFSIKNPDFLLQMDSTLCSLIRKLDVEKLKKTVQRFDSLNRDKRRFIQELSECFLLSTSIIESDSKYTVVVEAVKGMCKIPSNRLIHFIQKNYPQLFKSDKPTSLKNVKMPPVSINEFSYAGRMKSINDMNKS